MSTTLQSIAADATRRGDGTAVSRVAAGRSISRWFGFKRVRSGVRSEAPSLIAWLPVTIVSDVPVVSTGRRPGTPACDRPASPRQSGVPSATASTGAGGQLVGIRRHSRPGTRSGGGNLRRAPREMLRNVVDKGAGY